LGHACGWNQYKKAAEATNSANTQTSSNSSSAASSSSSEFASTDQIPIPVGKVEDMEKYLDSVEQQIKEKEQELKSLLSVVPRFWFLLQKVKPADGINWPDEFYTKTF